MKLIFNTFLLAFILFISGCSSKKLTIRSLQPSKIENEKIHTIRVDRFYRDDVNQTEIITGKIANKIVDNQRVFELRYNDFGTDAVLAGEVLNSSLDTYVYYRSEVDYSRCRFYRYDEKNRTKRCIEYAVRYIPCENRDYNVTTNVQLIKPVTNNIIFSKTYDKSTSENICFDHPYPFHNRLSSNAIRVNSQIANEIATDLIDDISPHYVYFNINIIEELDEDNPLYTKEQRYRFEKIVDLIENTNLDIAKLQLESLNQELNGKSFEVIYNLALINEAFGQLAYAHNLYNQAKLMTQNIEYLDLINYGINRTIINLEERIKAKSQLP